VRLRVLLTNLSLCARSGTEMHAYDLARELSRRGHAPTVYTPMPGAVADELRADGVPVVSTLASETEPPHVIHGHHHVETMSAVLRFPGVPAVFVCHDRTAWHDAPPLHPRIRAYVAVDEPCRERLAEEGVPDDRVGIIPNAVDPWRFRPRGPLPDRPRRALLFSNYAAEHTHLPVVREACRRAGLELDAAGSGSGNPCARPEGVLGNYDIVFAKARCALEAMAVGCAVVLCDPLGAGPLVRAADWPALRPLNFGRRACANPLTPEKLLAEVARYDAADAAEVCRVTRADAGIEDAADAFLALYDAVTREQAASPASPASLDDEARAAAEYLRTRLAYPIVSRAGAADVESWKASAEAAHRGWAALRTEYELLHAACGAAQRGWEAAGRGWAELQNEYERTLAECRRLQALLNQPRAA
jgi:hypothetical protein